MDTNYTSPFAPICNVIAKKFDDADIAGDRDQTETLIEEAKCVIQGIPAYAPLYYSIGTSLTILRDEAIATSQAVNPYTDPTVVKIHSEALWYFRHAEELLNQIEEKEQNRPYINGVKLILYVNYGNALDVCGRKCSAISYFSKALSISPSFGLALGNIARCLEHYASLEGDLGHRAVLFKKAYGFYEQALLSSDPATYEEAKEGFRRRRDQLVNAFGEEALAELPKYNRLRVRGKEKAYREWCLSNHLFLNTLNDLQEQDIAFVADPLHIISITTSIEQGTVPAVFEMFNQIKEEYVYARYLLYEVVNSSQEINFADKKTSLDDVLNYSSYSIRLEKLKTAYRTLYSLFDRVAFLLNDYLNIGMNERAVGFDRIFDQNGMQTVEESNIAIQALHWINRDFKDKFGESDTPHTRKLKDLRNALEHKFVSLHLFSLEKEAESGSDNIYRVSEDSMID